MKPSALEFPVTIEVTPEAWRHLQRVRDGREPLDFEGMEKFETVRLTSLVESADESGRPIYEATFQVWIVPEITPSSPKPCVV